MHQITAYLEFLRKSTNQHGVHSPFVYDLVTKCFYDKRKYPSYDQLKKYRQQLLQNKNTIKVNDLGAGSRVFKSAERKISDITNNSGTTLKRARLLNRLVRYLNVKQALELGTSVGIGTAAMAADNSVKVLSLEGCPETAAVARDYLRETGLRNIEIRIGDFQDLLNSLAPSHNVQNKISDSNFDLVYFDGNHQKQPTLEYFEKLLPYAFNESVFIFDDIHWSREMEEAWEEIKANPAVKVSIDTFQWGLVFFRREQEKQHFAIRV